jgi:transcriptional regulator with XRE-family HTH domain
MSMNFKKLVKVMKRKRQAEGLSIRALSAKIGVSFSSLARVERGDGEPDNNSAIRILEWLGADGRESGLSFDDVAYVHFRAEKNIDSKTVRHLLAAASAIKGLYQAKDIFVDDSEESVALSLSKPEMEDMAEEFRADLGVGPDEALDSLRIRVNDVAVFVPADIKEIDQQCKVHLTGVAASMWSAMSVPIDLENDRWAILRNDNHTIERQRVTYLEECWHIMLGHKLTKIAKITDSYGRTYDSAEEHDAYYLAAASLLPKAAVSRCVGKGEGSDVIALKFGVSQQLVEYRIKRLGLWKAFRGKTVSMD